jgi:hypothetical protein
MRETFKRTAGSLILNQDDKITIEDGLREINKAERED